MKKNIKAFSFAELLVSIIILATLSTLAVMSYRWNLENSRDAQRTSDLTKLSSALKLYSQENWRLPNPWNNFNITYNSNVVALQWKFNNQVSLSNLDNLPNDPRTETWYFYSITSNFQEFELAATLEKWDIPLALTTWNYKSVSKNILPSIVLALERNPWENAEIMSWQTDSTWANWSENNQKFILDNQWYNIPYIFVEPYEPYSDLMWRTVSEIVSELEQNNDYWQNINYRNCEQIENAWKNLQDNWSSLEYQILNQSWSIANTNCTF